MKFQYEGPVSPIKTDLKRYRRRLESVYKGLFTKEQIYRVEEAEENLLHRGNFAVADDEAPPGQFGVNLRIQGGLAVDWNGELISYDEHGNQAPQGRVITMPQLRFRKLTAKERKFEEWFHPPYLETYVHEYNHFIAYVLQLFPMNLAYHILDMVNAGTVQDIKPAEWFNLMKSSVRFHLYHLNELFTERLEDLVISEMGYEAFPYHTVDSLKGDQQKAGRYLKETVYSFDVSEFIEIFENWIALRFSQGDELWEKDFAEFFHNYVDSTQKIEVVKAKEL